MNHYALKQKPENIGKEFVIPFLLQILLVVVAIVPHRLFINRGENIFPVFTIGDEIAKPTSGRFAYLFVAITICVILAIIASQLSKKGKIYEPFFIGILSGTFLWQFIGEDAWNFGVYEEGEYVSFLRMESIQVLPLVIAFLLFVFYCIKNHSLDWGILNVVLSFLCNWMGHYVSHGTYPLVSNIMSMELWAKIVGVGFGSFVMLFALYLGIRCSKDIKARLTASMILYVGFGIMAFAFV